MPYQRYARSPAIPASSVRWREPGSVIPLTRMLGAKGKNQSANRNCATELLSRFRNRLVVMKSVCTPVPPITNGSAAGGVRLAPPASALSKMATRRLAASGTNLSVIQRVLRDGCKRAFNRNGPRTAIPIARILQFSGKPVLLSRPRAANGTGLPARVQRTGTDCRLGPSRCLALKRAIRDRSSSLASGNRVNSHTSPVWSGHTRA